jgi:putative peptidoglycan lipid II flippase
LLSGVLNSLGKFAAAAAAPVALNVVLIGTLAAIHLFGLAGTEMAGIWLVWGVSFAGVVQLAMVHVAASRAGMTLRLVRPRLTPGVRRLIALGVPGVIGGGITQINLLIGTIVASLQDGAVAFLYYADRIYQLPLGVIGIAIGVVLLPDLSRRLRAGDEQGALYAQNRAIETSMLLTLPAAVALAVIPVPVISVLFERGAFDAADTTATASALAAFAFGLPAFVLVKLLSPGYFAREDTRTPMWFAGISVVFNIVGAIGLFYLMGHVGIAIATTVAGWINAGLLGWRLAMRGEFRLDERSARRLPLIGLASAVMGIALWLALSVAAPWLANGAPVVVRAAALAGLVVFGAAGFWGVAEITGAGKARELLATARRR